jgi:hypothetical protein
MRPIYFEDGVLRTISIPYVGTILKPAIQDQFMAKMVVAHSDYEMILHPHEGALEGKTRRFKRVDETCQ